MFLYKVMGQNMNLSDIWVRSCKETKFSHCSALDGDWKGSIKNLPQLEDCKCDASFSFLF